MLVSHRRRIQAARHVGSDLYLMLGTKLGCRRASLALWTCADVTVLHRLTGTTNVVPEQTQHMSTLTDTFLCSPHDHMLTPRCDQPITELQTRTGDD